MNILNNFVCCMCVVFIVFFKEVWENLCDCCMFISVFFIGLLFMLLMFVMLINFIINCELDKVDKLLKVLVIGVQYVFNLVDVFKVGGVVLQLVIVDLEVVVCNQEIDFVLCICVDYLKVWCKGELVQVEVIYDFF